MRGDRIKERREELGLSQAELGERIKMDDKDQPLQPQAVYRYEKNLTKPSSEMIVKFCKALGVTSDWLLGLVENKDEHLDESDLSPMEKRLINAIRSGKVPEAIEMALKLTQDQNKNKPPRAKPGRNKQSS